MSTTPISSDQIRALQATRRRVGIDDETWRERLQTRFDVVSTKHLSAAQAGQLLDELRGGASAGSVRPQALTGPYAAKARALWISLWQLGAIEDRRDSALLAWVERQTGMRSLSWVREHRDGVRVIEGLKDWCAREGVAWHPERSPKAAVLAAIRDKLFDLGIDHEAIMPSPERCAQIDEVASDLGRALRAAMRRQQR